MQVSRIIRAFTDRSGSVRTGVAVLMAGTIAGQTLPILASLILTRLFTPHEFGVFALFMAITAVLASFISGRYELAVILPEHNKQAANLALAGLAIAGISSLMILAIAIFANGWLTRIFGVQEIGPWLYFVAPTAFFMVLFLFASYWLNRQHAYGTIATSDIVLRAGTEGSRITTGIFKTASNGLIIGQIIGLIVSAIFALWQAHRITPWKRRWFNRKEMLTQLKRYHSFPLYTLPQGFIDTLGTEAIPALLTSGGMVVAAGYYLLAKRIVTGPIGLLSSSLRRVYFKEAAAGLGSKRLIDLFRKLMYAIAEGFTPAFVLFAWWAPEIFTILFGENWREAGVYAVILSPMAFMHLFTRWPDRTYEVANKQNISLAIQTISDIIRIGSLVLLIKGGCDARTCIMVYSGMSVLHHFAYLTGIFKSGHFELKIAIQTAVRVLLTGLPTGMLLWVGDQLFTHNISSFIAGCLLLGAYYIVLAYRWKILPLIKNA